MNTPPKPRIHGASYIANGAVSSYHLLSAGFRRKWRRWRSWHQWILLYHFSPEPFPPSSISEFRAITPPEDRFWADPHLFLKNGRYYIFLEEYLYESKKGHLSVMELDVEGRYTDPGPVLVRDHHLSYPFVFEHRGEIFMVPETLALRRIELYRCIRFPADWEFVRVLIDRVDAVDSTLIYRNGCWWLFTNIIDNPGSAPSDELFLFYSDDLLTSPWIPHAMNPIVSDIRRARPAGPLFETGTKLYRPGQIASPWYGYGIAFHEVTKLTPDAYEEVLMHSVKPPEQGNLIGSHTFASAPGLALMDGLMRRREIWHRPR